MDIMMTEKRLEQMEKIEHMMGAASFNHTDVDWSTEDTSFWVAGHRSVRPHERSLGPLTETDGDVTVVDNLG